MGDLKPLRCFTVLLLISLTKKRNKDEKKKRKKRQKHNHIDRVLKTTERYKQLAASREI